MPRILGPIVPAGPFEGMQDHYLKGGMRSVPNIATRDALIGPHRRAGMLVLTQDNMALWRLRPDGTTWDWAGSGGYLDIPWAAEVTVQLHGYEYQRLVCSGDTTVTVSAAPVGARCVMQLANSSGSPLVLAWIGVLWPSGMLKRLAPGERVYVRLTGTPEGVVGTVYRQGAVQPKLPAQDKLAAYWPLDRRVANVYEELMSGKAMTAPNSWLECPGILNRGSVQISQDGTITQLLRVQDDAFRLSTASAFSLRFWFRAGSGGYPELLASVADTTERLMSGDLRLTAGGGNLTATLFNDTVQTAQLALPDDGLWHRCVLTWTADGSVMRLVLDDASVTAGPVDTGGAGGDRSLNFGASTAAGIPGYAVDEVAFWRDHALSPAEIEDDMGGGVLAAGTARPVFGGGDGTVITFEYSLHGSPVW